MGIGLDNHRDEDCKLTETTATVNKSFIEPPHMVDGVDSLMSPFSAMNSWIQAEDSASPGLNDPHSTHLSSGEKNLDPALSVAHNLKCVADLTEWVSTDTQVV